MAVAAQLLPDLARPIGAVVVVPHVLNGGAQVVIALPPG
jgi:hypothetical protein